MVYQPKTGANQAHFLRFANEPKNFPDSLKPELVRFIKNQVELQRCTQKHFAEVKGFGAYYISMMKNQYLWKNIADEKWWNIARKVGFRIDKNDIETASVDPAQKAESTTQKSEGEETTNMPPKDIENSTLDPKSKDKAEKPAHKRNYRKVQRRIIKENKPATEGIMIDHADELIETYIRKREELELYDGISDSLRSKIKKFLLTDLANDLIHLSLPENV